MVVGNPSEWEQALMQTRNEKASKRGCLILSILVFVVLPLSLIVLLVLLWYGRESSGARRLKARLDAIVKQGDPIDDDSMDSFYKDRTDPTNTKAWLAVFATMASEDFKAFKNGVPYVGIEPEQPILPEGEWEEEQVSVAFVERWKTLFSEVIRLAVDAKPVRFPIDFDSFSTLLVNTQETRNVAALLVLQGRVGLRARDSALVRECIDALIGLSHVNAGEPLLVSQMVTYAIDGLALGLLKDALEYDVLNEPDLHLLLPKVLAAIHIGGDWKGVISGERAMALPIFSNPNKARSLGVTPVPGRSRDAIFFLDLTQSVMDIPTEDLSDFNAKLLEAEAKFIRQAQAGWLSQIDAILTMQITPAFGAAGAAFVRRALQHRIAALAIGLRLYEDKYARFPDSLGDLSELNLDTKVLSPTQDRSFGYRRKDGGATLWGSSLKDAFTIPAEPPEVSEVDPKSTGYGFWRLELRAIK